MKKIVPCLWFDKNAEEAANFYVDVWNGAPHSKGNSEVKGLSHYGKFSSGSANMPEGSVMTAVFELDGQEFMGLNGGPIFKFSEAVSLMIYCKDQAEIDYFWEKLSAVPESEQCGWLKDKYGLSWQVVPENLGKYMGKDPEKTEKVMAALLDMKKLDIAELERAAEQ